MTAAIRSRCKVSQIHQQTELHVEACCDRDSIRRFARAEGPCKHVSLSADVEFIGRVGDRVTGKKLEDLVFVELFSGTGGLCAEVRRLGLSNSIGVDAHISKHTKCPVLRIDMTTDYGMELVWRILGQENCIAVHMGPPCGTSSRARDIRRRKGPDPKPLRSDRWPDGLPSLQGSDKRRVGLANELYLQCAKIFEYCTRVGILCTIENPGNSYLWSTTFMTGLAVGYNDVLNAADPQRTVECAIGIPWEPWEFIEQAKGHGHPKLFVHGVPKPLERTIQWIVGGETPCNIAKYQVCSCYEVDFSSCRAQRPGGEAQRRYARALQTDTGRKMACITGYYDQRSQLW